MVWQPSVVLHFYIIKKIKIFIVKEEKSTPDAIQAI
jgi:hypothetical protein